MQATHTYDLDLEHLLIDLPKSAKHASVLQHLKHQALVSLGQFCDSGYTCLLTESAVYLVKDNVETKIGTRDFFTKLWAMDKKENHDPKLSQLPLQANNAYTQKP